MTPAPRTGTDVREALATLSDHDRPGGVHLALSPGSAEILGIALAEAIRDLGATTIVGWDDSESVVLGHIVARELGIDLVQAWEDQGLLHWDRAPADKARVILVAVCWDDVRSLEALQLFVGGNASVAGVAALVATDQLTEHSGGHPTVALTPAEEK